MIPCFLRSTGLRPATSMPQGAFVMQPSMGEVGQFEPYHPVIGTEGEGQQCLHHAGGDPPVLAPPQRRGEHGMATDMVGGVAIWIPAPGASWRMCVR